MKTKELLVLRLILETFQYLHLRDTVTYLRSTTGKRWLRAVPTGERRRTAGSGKGNRHG
jgi:hypothetical protein